MLPPPPRSTLFPYTTLFRSVFEILRHESNPVLELSLDRVGDECFRLFHFGFQLLRERIDRGLQIQDRKSTRLNSSHSQISYAVFCLKKKKKNYHKHTHPLVN